MLKAENERSHGQAHCERQQQVVAFGFCGLGWCFGCLVDGGAQQRREDQRQRKLDQRPEDHRRKQRIEDTAEHTAQGNQQVELRQAAHRRPCAGQFAVTHQGNRKQSQQVHQKQDWQWNHHLGYGWKEREQQQGGQSAHQPMMRNQRSAGEDQHEAQQINRQRQYPEERNGRNVGGQHRGDANHQA